MVASGRWGFRQCGTGWSSKPPSSEPNAYGYRPGRGALDAVKEVQASILRGESHVVDADISNYFDTIPHDELMRSVARRISTAISLPVHPEE